MRTLILAALACVAAPVGAQTMYRCGNTFSQQPCGPGAEVIESQKPRPGAYVTAPPIARPAALDLPAPADVVDAAKASCVDRLRKDIAFKDPDSVKVLGIERRGLQTVAGQQLRLYVMRVNARNSYGAYSGEKDFFCLADRADERVTILVRLAAYER